MECDISSSGTSAERCQGVHHSADSTRRHFLGGTPKTVLPGGGGHYLPGRAWANLGYLARSQVADKILASSYVYPPDFDEATRDLCMECAHIRSIVPANSVSPRITTTQWKRGWSKMREDTSSSESGLHFGHYKAGTQSWMISKFHALKATLLMKRGLVLDRWGRGLLVMLEKMFG